jgi:hypothetical protein
MKRDLILWAFVGLLTLAVTMPALAGGPVFPPKGAITLCDSYGREWSISFPKCGPDLKGVTCVTGFRDVNNELGCGALPLDGTLTYDLMSVSWVLSVTAFDTSGNCLASHWSAKSFLPRPDFHGYVSNDNGPFGPFDLKPCVPGAAGILGATGDPALP